MREVVVHIFRHGDKPKTGEDNLTELGEKQAREAGARLAAQLPTGAIVKFAASPAVRAQKTMKLAAQEFEKIQERQVRMHPRGVKRIALPTIHDKAALKQLIGELGGMPGYFEAMARDEVPETIQESRTSMEARMLKRLVEIPRNLHERLPDGNPIHLVYVSHAGEAKARPLALNAVLAKLIGKTPLDVPDENGEKTNFKPAEGFSLHLVPEKDAFVRFRGKEFPVKPSSSNGK